MKRIAMSLTGFLGLITLGIGAVWFVLGASTIEVIGGQDLGSLRSSEAFGFADNAFRFFAGIWIVTGFGLFYCLMDFEKRTALLRVIMAGLFLGGIGRALSMAQFGVIEAMVPPTAIELILPPIIIWLQSRSRA